VRGADLYLTDAVAQVGVRSHLASLPLTTRSVLWSWGYHGLADSPASAMMESQASDFNELNLVDADSQAVDGSVPAISVALALLFDPFWCLSSSGRYTQQASFSQFAVLIAVIARKSLASKATSAWRGLRCCHCPGSSSF
jgi:hypothetical protein